MSKARGKILLFALGAAIIWGLNPTQIHASASDSVEVPEIGQWFTFSVGIPWISGNSDKKQESEPIMTMQRSAVSPFTPQQCSSRSTLGAWLLATVLAAATAITIVAVIRHS